MKKTPSNSPFKRGEFKASALPSSEGGVWEVSFSD